MPLRSLAGFLALVLPLLTSPTVAAGTTATTARPVTEYHLYEVQVWIGDRTPAQAEAQANAIVAVLKTGKPYYGIPESERWQSQLVDLGWVLAEQLPPEVAANVRLMRPGQLLLPHRFPELFSIFLLTDARERR